MPRGLGKIWWRVTQWMVTLCRLPFAEFGELQFQSNGHTTNKVKIRAVLFNWLLIVEWRKDQTQSCRQRATSRHQEERIFLESRWRWHPIQFSSNGFKSKFQKKVGDSEIMNWNPRWCCSSCCCSCCCCCCCCYCSCCCCYYTSEHLPVGIKLKFLINFSRQ